MQWYGHILCTWSVVDHSSYDWGRFSHSLYHVDVGKRPDRRLCFPNKVFRCKSSVINVFKNPFDEVVAEDGYTGDCSLMRHESQKQGAATREFKLGTLGEHRERY